MTNRRICNHVPEALMLKIAEAAASWITLRQIEKQYGDNAGLGADMRSAELRMRAAFADLPEPPAFPILTPKPNHSRPKAPLAWDHPANRYDPNVERVAEQIYNSWVPGIDVLAKRPWVPHGESRRQDEARVCARHKLQQDGHGYADGELA